jgi:hypothetical protein
MLQSSCVFLADAVSEAPASSKANATVAGAMVWTVDLSINEFPFNCAGAPALEGPWPRLQSSLERRTVL